MSTGNPSFERVSHAAKRDDEEGGQDKGGKERIPPLGRPDNAMEIPAIWYL